MAQRHLKASDQARERRPKPFAAFDFCSRFGYNVPRIPKDLKEQDNIG
jgi:hypothetical protein